MTLLAHFLFLTLDKTCFVPTLIDCRFFWGDFRHLRSPVTFQHVLFLNEGERQQLGLRDRPRRTPRLWWRLFPVFERAQSRLGGGVSGEPSLGPPGGHFRMCNLM